MDLAAVFPAEIGMAKLVEGFADDQARIEKEKVVGIQHPLGLISQGRKVVRHDLQRPRHDHEPDQRSDPTDGVLDHRQGAHQEAVWIQEWDAGEHDVQQARSDLSLPGLLVALEQLRRVRRRLVLQQVGLVKLGEKLDDRFLTRGFIRKPLQAFFPDLLDRAARTQPGNKLISGWPQSEKLIAERILQHDPTLPPIALPMHFHRRAEAEPLVRHPVPGLAEGWPAPRSSLPPEEKPQKIRGAMGEDPEQGPPLDRELAARRSCLGATTTRAG